MVEVLVVLVAVVGVPLVWGIVLYNGLVRLRQMVMEGWSGIDVQLKRRANLIPNLIETIKGIMGHERETPEAVTELRARSLGGGGPGAQGAAEGALGRSLAGLFAVAPKTIPSSRPTTILSTFRTNPPRSRSESSSPGATTMAPCATTTSRSRVSPASSSPAGSVLSRPSSSRSRTAVIGRCPRSASGTAGDPARAARLHGGSRSGGRAGDGGTHHRPRQQNHDPRGRRRHGGRDHHRGGHGRQDQTRYLPGLSDRLRGQSRQPGAGPLRGSRGPARRRAGALSHRAQGQRGAGLHRQPRRESRARRLRLHPDLPGPTGKSVSSTTSTSSTSTPSATAGNFPSSAPGPLSTCPAAPRC